MNEETKVTTEVAATETQETNVSAETSSSKGSGSGSLGVLVVGALIAGGVGLFKNRKKLTEKKTEKQIKKLEKQGYVVSRMEIVDTEPVEEPDVEPEEVDSDEE